MSEIRLPGGHSEGDRNIERSHDRFSRVCETSAYFSCLMMHFVVEKKKMLLVLRLTSNHTHFNTYQRCSFQYINKFLDANITPTEDNNQGIKYLTENNYMNFKKKREKKRETG